MTAIPHLTPVKSTHIQALGHKGDRLFIRFGSGHVFSYEGVSDGTYKEFLAAESPGKYFHAHIKGKHRHTAHDA